MHAFSRTELLIGKEGVEKLAEAHVAIFGVGGVGSFVAEGLVRAGIGRFLLVDDDCVCLTNLNRQIHATIPNIGKPKVEVMKERILSINPAAEVAICQSFYLPGMGDSLLKESFSYLVDAIDTVTAKIDLIVECKNRGIPVISSMGTGNKLDPKQLEITDISKTSMCPLAKVMRKELRDRGIISLKVVFSKEKPIIPATSEELDCKSNCVCPPDSPRHCVSKRQTPGSISFVPSTAGLLIAGEVVRDILQFS